MCKRIRHNLKIDTLEVFLEENIGVQSIQSHQSRMLSYDITNRGTDQSANADTSKTLEIVFRIVFEN